MYDHLANNSDKAVIIFLNNHNEFFVVNKLQTLKKTKTKIVSKWRITSLSDNKFPFSHASLIVDGKQILFYEIPKLDYLSNGLAVIEYESEN